jgi:hypothetical protein
VQALATLFDEGEKDDNGQTFSQGLLARGLGTHCFGTVTFVLKKKGRDPQTYRVKWDDGTNTKINHQHLEAAAPLSDEEEGADDDADGEDNTLTVDGDVTDEEDGSACMTRPVEHVVPVDGGVDDANNVCAMGESVIVNDVEWTRVAKIVADTREEVADFDLSCRNWTLTANTPEIDAFWHCMPVSRDQLLEVLRHRANEARCKYKTWRHDHVDAALTIMIGGAQYKTGTDLWATERKGMVEAPDFGRVMSHDRFHRCLRYWARGPAGRLHSILPPFHPSSHSILPSFFNFFLSFFCRCGRPAGTSTLGRGQLVP